MTNNQNQQLTVNVISESVLVPGGHGSHTAFLNYWHLLQTIKSLKVFKNAFFTRVDINHYHTIGPFSLLKMLTSKKNVVTVHVIPDTFTGSWKGSKNWLGFFKAYFKFFYSQADLILAVAPLEKEILLKLGIKGQIEVFPNPIDSAKFRPEVQLKSRGRELLKISPEDFVVLGVGQVQSRKGILTFIQVAQKLPNLKFIWVGGTPFKFLTEQEEELKELLKNPPSNFKLVSEITYDQMPLVYNGADLFLFPSYQENAPMVVIEAALCGLPLVLRDIKEYQLLYKENYLASDSVEGFAEIIDKLSKDRKYFEQIKNEALKLASAYTFEALGEKLVKLYKSIN